MKRENIALLALARHEPTARRELGLKYLTGTGGFPQHEQLALEYLGHPSIRDTDEVARIIGDHLSLERSVSLGQEGLLVRAAQAGSAEARFKLGVWQLLGHGSLQEGLRWISAAKRSGHPVARRIVTALDSSTADESTLFEALLRHSKLRLDVVCLAAAEQAAKRADLSRLAYTLHLSLRCSTAISTDEARLLKRAVQIADATSEKLQYLTPEQIQAGLRLLVADGDMEAALVLGRAYCGIDGPTVSAEQIVQAPNLRMGAALLLRAADAGSREAWMHLHRVHADHRCSVANPQLSRFFLEKAAALGDTEAQRRLGASILQGGTKLADSEAAIHWLHAAANRGDAPAQALLRTLVLPIGGDDAAATRAIELIRSRDPWLAARLRLSRDFGLTKLEALCVDPVAGKRAWGLVVGQNPYIVLPKLSAPRAVPALTTDAADSLCRVALLFESGRRDGDLMEGDWSRRSLNQRRAFARYGIEESLFFAKVSSTTLDSFRKGSKWAVRAKASLAMALTRPSGSRVQAVSSRAGNGS